MENSLQALHNRKISLYQKDKMLLNSDKGKGSSMKLCIRLLTIFQFWPSLLTPFGIQVPPKWASLLEKLLGEKCLLLISSKVEEDSWATNVSYAKRRDQRPFSGSLILCQVALGALSGNFWFQLGFPLVGETNPPFMARCSKWAKSARIFGWQPPQVFLDHLARKKQCGF